MNYSFLNFKLARQAKRICILDIYSCTKNILLISQETTEICLLKKCIKVKITAEAALISAVFLRENNFSDKFFKSRIAF